MAIELMKAQVVITGALAPLKKAMNAAKKLVSKTMSAITATIKKMVSITKKALIGLAAIYTIATVAAMKQEKAEFLLAASIKATGESAEAVMPKFKKFAAQIQKITVYGDEDIMMLMQLMNSLGVTSDALENATKHAIGMAAATGRDVRSMAMYIALAAQGEFTMLRRYIPALRSTTDETEQLAIITKFAAAGFKIAQAEAKITAGALKQMKNAVGDVFEAIGKPFLDNITRSAHALRNWSIANQAAIGKLSERFDAFLTRIVPMAVTKMREWGEIIWSGIKTTWNFITDLWESNTLASSLKVGLDLVTKQLVQWGKQILIIMTKVGKDIANALWEPITKIHKKFLKLGPEKPLMTLSMPETPSNAPKRKPWQPFKTKSWLETIAEASAVPKAATSIPKEVSKPFKDLTKAMRENTKAIQERFKGKGVPKLDFTKPTMDALTPFDITAKGEKKKGGEKKVGFIGLEEAWSRFASGITKQKEPEELTAKSNEKIANNTSRLVQIAERKKLKRELEDPSPAWRSLFATLGTVTD